MAEAGKSTVDRRRVLQSGLVALGAGGAVTLLPHEVARAVAKPAHPARPGFTTGHYRPTERELTVAKLEVEGAIPPILSG